MTGWVRLILERYGQKVTVQTGETTVDVRAFLQPVPERSERAREEATPIGWVDVRLWLYLGQMALEETDTHWRVMVTDDGVGFDPAAAVADGAIGLGNVRRRLSRFPGCGIHIQSAPGQGTRVVLTYRKEPPKGGTPI